jgi:hypothetical protein
MYSKITRLRRAGQRRSDHDIGADSGLVGHVTIVTIENYQVAKVFSAGDSGSQTSAIPDLYRARCVTMHGDKMLFQGYELHGDRPIKQEWRIQVMQEPPTELATRSHRPG